MSRKSEFIGLNQAALNWLAANSAVETPTPNTAFNTFQERFDLRAWTVSGVLWLEKVQQEVQFPRDLIFTQLVKATDTTVIQFPWTVVTLDPSVPRQQFNRFYGNIYTS